MNQEECSALSTLPSEVNVNFSAFPVPNISGILSYVRMMETESLYALFISIPVSLIAFL